MAFQRDNGIRPPPVHQFVDAGMADDPTPRWLPALGLAVVLTLVAALARYAIDLLGIVFLIIVVGFSLRAVSDWLTEGDSVSIWSLVAVVSGLAGTAMVGTWLFGSTSLTARVARPVRVPSPVVQTIDWLEARGWGQRVLLREGPGQVPGAPGLAPEGGLDMAGQRGAAPPSTEGLRFDWPDLRTRGRRSQEPAPGEAEAAPIRSSRVGATATRDGRPAGGNVDTETVLRTAHEAVESGTPIRLTAFVSAAAGAPAPRGQVVFYRGSEMLGVVALEPTTGGAAAQLSTRDVPAGRHELVAVYTGNETFQSSRSAAITQTVTPR